MRSIAEEILKLQSFWSNKNTPEMSRRGQLIRHTLSEWVNDCENELASVMGKPGSFFNVGASDGAGRKTEVPWVRFCSKKHSPSATQGWYCVLLFHAKGDGFYLALSHGSTRWEGGDFKPRSKNELSALVGWARDTLSKAGAETGSLVKNIELGAKGRLGKSYEDSTAFAIWYPKNDLPSEDNFIEDLKQFSSLLGELYAAEDLELSPDNVIRQAEEVQIAVSEISDPKRKKGSYGQGFGLSHEERLAVEMCAMNSAKKYLLQNGYQVKDTSKNKPYDFLATKDGVEKIVEVKGTTGNGGSIILTANEVEAHLSKAPDNFLIVLHSIDLDRKCKPPKASGGKRVVLSPWHIEEENLKALSYQYLSEGII